MDPGIVDPAFIFDALSGAIVWNVVAGRLGILSSSSHALVGRLSAVIWHGLGIIGSAIVLSPAAGLVIAMALVLAVSWLAVRAPRPLRWTGGPAFCSSCRPRC